MRQWSKRDVLTYLAKVSPVLSKMDHFELLDVDADASLETIQKAFHAMASALHPDRHRNSLSSAEREGLTIVYAKIAEAYRVLRNPTERDAYLKQAARHKARQASSAPKALSTEDSLSLLSPKAQKLYRRARASLRTGDKTSAKLYLKMALSQHPQSTFLKDAFLKVK